MNVMKNIKIVLNNSNVKTPMRSTKGSAGYDVFAEKDYLLPAGEIVDIQLPFSFIGDLEQDVQVRMYVRSSFGIKKKVRLVYKGLKTIEGVTLDLNKKNNVISLLNDSEEDLIVKKDEHFAQFIISVKNPGKEKQKIEALTRDELGKVVPVKGYMIEVEPDIYDFVLEEDVKLAPYEQIAVPSGYRTVIEDGTWTAIVIHGDIRNSVMLANQTAVIDADYQNNPKTKGNCFLALVSLKNESLVLTKGTKVTRWYTEKYYTFENEIKSNKIRNGGVGSTTKAKEGR